MDAMVFKPKNLQTIFKIFHAVVKPLDLLVEDHRHDIVGAVLTEWPEVARLVNVYFPFIQEKIGGDFPAFRWTFTPAREAVPFQERRYCIKICRTSAALFSIRRL